MLPANISDLKNALQRTRDFANHAAQGGTYLKMDKGGQWTIGTDQEEVEADAEWAINPAAFFTGFNAFDAAGVKHGEETSLLTAPPVSAAQLPDVPAPWKPLIGTTMKCLSGDHEGTEAIVSQSSINGMKSLGNVLDAIMNRVEDEDEECIPIVTLGHSKYRHKKYGVIYSAEFTIVDWMASTGEEVEQEEVKEEPKARKAIKQKADEVVEDAEIVEEKPARRRRRA